MIRSNAPWTRHAPFFCTKIRKSTVLLRSMSKSQILFFVTGAFFIGGTLGVIVMKTLPLHELPPISASESTMYSTQKMPRLYTNEQFIDDIRTRHLDLDNIDTVFSFVFDQLNNSVNIYPTENYYYFRFFSEGREVLGNLRLDSIDREQGSLSFAYFYGVNRKEGKQVLYSTTHHKNLGSEDGVIVQKIRNLEYAVSYNGRTVTFHLHDLSQAEPKMLKLHNDEVFVARTFDESGFQFVLIYDQQNPAFRFIIDPEAPLPDMLQPHSSNLVFNSETHIP